MLSRRSMLAGAMGVLVGSTVSAAGGRGSAHGPSGGGDAVARAFAHEWANMHGRLTALAALSPPGGARVYAYATLAEYEAWSRAAGGNDGLAARLQVPPSLPAAGFGLDPATVVASAHATVAMGLMSYPDTRKKAQTLYDDQLRRRRSAGVGAGTVARSAAFGGELATAILAWAATDGRAEASRGGYVPSTGPGGWIPTSPIYGPATDPFAGEVRTLVLRTAGELAPAGPPPFSDRAGTRMYEQAQRVYDASRSLTDAQRELAFFWADGTANGRAFHSVGGTPGPAGHWLRNACAVELRFGLAPLPGSRLRARVTIAMHDAMTSCWHHKYRYNLLRPETYIIRHIDPEWRPILMTPSFPEYPSGHSVVSYAAARVLSEVTGAEPFIDDSWAHFGVPGRTFASVHDAAGSASHSRLIGGIHYPLGIDDGAELGKHIGERVSRQLSP